jgi:hypothetical protein
MCFGTTVEINGQKNSSFCTPPAVKRTFHGDQWVTLEIDVQGQSHQALCQWRRDPSVSKIRSIIQAHELGKTVYQGQ